MIRQWQLARRSLAYGERTLVMGVLNVTPDSFSDGGQFFSPERAVAHAEQMINDGADLIDIGGESTRPGSEFVTEEEELRRVIPVIERLAGISSVPISIDTTKSSVARAALEAGAETVSVSLTSFIAPEFFALFGVFVLAAIAPGADFASVVRESISFARQRGVASQSIAIDPGIGFGKTAEQNLELIANLDQIARALENFPIMIGASRKSFIGKLLDSAPADQRLYGTIASTVVAAMNGAHIVRVHDVKAAVDAVRIVDAIARARRES